MKRIALLCLIIFVKITNGYSQAYDYLASVPPQIMQLGRGTANVLGWHPDGHILAVGGSLGVWLYNDSLEDLAHFPDAGVVDWLTWSPNGNQLATVDRDDTLNLWNATLDTYSFVLNRSWTFHNDSYFTRIYWSPDSERVAVPTSSGAQILDVNTGETVLMIPELEFVLAWNRNGTQIAGEVDLGEGIGKQIRVWDATTGAIINTYMSTDTDLLWSNIQWSPDDSTLVGTTSLPATIHVWNSKTGDLMNKSVKSFAADMSFYFDIWWLDGGQQLATVSRDLSPPAISILDVWETESWTTLDQELSLGEIQNIAKHPTKDVWAGLTWSSKIVLWSLERREILQTLSVHSQSPNILIWSSNSQHLATANRVGGSINIWDVAMFDQPQLQVIAVPYPSWDLDELRWSSDDGRLLGFQSIPQITAPGAFPIAFVVEWDIKTGEFLRTIHETQGYVAHDSSDEYLPHYTWNNDFSRVVTHLSDHPITISTVVSENGFLSPGETLTAISIVDYPLEIVWSPDNTMIAIITRDPQDETSARVYDAQSGDLINQLRPSFFTLLYDISWSPDSSMVALVGRRGIAGSGETEYRLDIFEIDPSSDEAAYITTILDIDTTFYHDWRPDSHAIAVSTSKGIGIYVIESVAMGVDAVSSGIIPDMHVFALAWSPNSRWLAGGHEDGTVRIWNVEAIE